MEGTSHITKLYALDTLHRGSVLSNILPGDLILMHRQSLWTEMSSYSLCCIKGQATLTSDDVNIFRSQTHSTLALSASTAASYLFSDTIYPNRISFPISEHQFPAGLDTAHHFLESAASCSYDHRRLSGWCPQTHTVWVFRRAPCCLRRSQVGYQSVTVGSRDPASA